MVRIPIIFIACATLLVGISFGIRGTFGLFLGPMTTDLGWSHATFALAVAMQNLIWGAAQPFFGVLAERIGMIRTVFFGTVIYLAGLLIMGLVPTEAGLHIGAGLLTGLGAGGTGVALLMAAAARVVAPEKRGLALGIVGSGAALGQFILPLVVQGSIDSFGWLIAIFVLAGICGLMVPLGFGMIRVDRLPRPTVAEQSIAAALREASNHKGFWLLNAGFFVCGYHVVYIATHLPSYLTHLGFEPGVGALALAIIGGVNGVMSIVAGYLGDRMRKKVLLSAFYLFRSIAITVFILAPPSLTSVIVFSVTMGSVWLSVVPLTGALVGQIFGARHMATLFGIVMFSHQVGAFFGAWTGGLVFDATGSYDIAWMIAIGLGIMSAIVHLPIPDKPLRLEEAPAEA